MRCTVFCNNYYVHCFSYLLIISIILCLKVLFWLLVSDLMVFQQLFKSCHLFGLGHDMCNNTFMHFNDVWNSQFPSHVYTNSSSCRIYLCDINVIGTYYENSGRRNFFHTKSIYEGCSINTWCFYICCKYHSYSLNLNLLFFQLIFNFLILQSLFIVFLIFFFVCEKRFYLSWSIKHSMF